MVKKEAAVGLLDQDRSERCRFKEEFMEIIAHEEIRWRQKARLKWLQEGDNIIKFFHSFANARRTSNRTSAVNVNGTYCEDSTRIEEEVIQYFKKAYMKNQKTEEWFSNWSDKSLICSKPPY